MNWSHRPALDGVRTLAVYLVVLYHAEMPGVAGGFIGVDLFFVLSGFLVSNVLLSEIDERGTLRLGRFYARRVRRLLPAAVLVVVVTGAVFVLVTSIVRRLAFVDDARSALLYFANWHFLSESNDYFATGTERSPASCISGRCPSRSSFTCSSPCFFSCSWRSAVCGAGHFLWASAC